MGAPPAHQHTCAPLWSLASITSSNLVDLLCLALRTRWSLLIAAVCWRCVNKPGTNRAAIILAAGTQRSKSNQVARAEARCSVASCKNMKYEQAHTSADALSRLSLCWQPCRETNVSQSGVITQPNKLMYTSRCSWLQEGTLEMSLLCTFCPVWWPFVLFKTS